VTLTVPATTQEARAQRDRTTLWRGALVTAAAALFFPKIEAVRNDDASPWQLAVFVVPGDREGLILIPLVILLTFALFALVGGWAWRDSEARNRPARVGLAAGLLGFVGVLAFFLSAPIIFGGLAVTLGIEGRRRGETEGRSGEAVAAIAVGAVAFLVGAGIWVFA
jgi:hypothetical protein